MLDKKRKLAILKAELDQEISSFLPHWRDLADFVRPRRIRLQTTDVNRGDKRNQKILDCTATLALRSLRAGMTSGISPPSRPWFRLTTPDPELAEYGSVKRWLDDVTNRMRTVFLRTNIYNSLATTYGDVGLFGTAALYMEEDVDKVFRSYTFPVGSFRIANNEKLKVDVFMREFRMTVRQVVERFGKQDPKTGKPMWDNISEFVKRQWDEGRYETWVDIGHVIHPNEEFEPRSALSKHKKYASCYYEIATIGNSSLGLMPDDKQKYLSESGYDLFPVLAPRWEVSGEDVYGTDCPGMTALGDVKQLQKAEARGLEGIEKKVRPAMTGPTSLKSQKASILPGDMTYLDVREGQQGFRAAHEVSLSLVELEEKQNQVRQRISRAMYEDLFLMLANSDRREITAREIEERHEEKLLALGPVLDQLNQDLLDPLIDNAFNYMLRTSIDANGQWIEGGLLPKPPEEIQGVDLKVEYISVMAQAQKLFGVASTERFMTNVMNLAAVVPDVKDKINFDHFIDNYGEQLSISPNIIRTEEETDKVRAAAMQAAKAQQEAEVLNQRAQAAAKLSQADMSTDNALTRTLNGLSGEPAI